MTSQKVSSEAYQAYRTWVSEPLAEDPVVSVVVPSYNEEWRILPTVGAIALHMSARGEPWELVVADDGSTDTTLELLDGIGFPNLRVLRAERNGGKGSAVRRGVLAARGRYVLFADADQSTPIEQFDQLLDHVKAGAGVVVGSRAAAGAQVSGRSPLRKFISRMLRLLVAVLTGVKVTDTQCGFKLFTAEAARELFSRQQLDGFSFDLEVLYIAGRRGIGIAEVPVEWIDAPGSTVDAIKVSVDFLKDMLRILWFDRRGRYRDPVPGRLTATTGQEAR